MARGLFRSCRKRWRSLLRRRDEKLWGQVRHDRSILLLRQRFHQHHPLNPQTFAVKLSQRRLTSKRVRRLTSAATKTQEDNPKATRLRNCDSGRSVASNVLTWPNHERTSYSASAVWRRT